MNTSELNLKLVKLALKTENFTFKPQEYMYRSGVELGFLRILTTHKTVDDDMNNDGVTSGGASGGVLGGEHGEGVREVRHGGE